MEQKKWFAAYFYMTRRKNKQANHIKLQRLTSLSPEEFMSLLSVFAPITEQYFQTYTLEGHARRIPKYQEDARCSLPGSLEKLKFILMYYSVPFTYIGKKVRIICSQSSIEVYHNQIRIALHRRQGRKYGYTTLEEHMPSSHRFVKKWSSEKFIAWAASIGEDWFNLKRPNWFNLSVISIKTPPLWKS